MSLCGFCVHSHTHAKYFYKCNTNGRKRHERFVKRKENVLVRTPTPTPTHDAFAKKNRGHRKLNVCSRADVRGDVGLFVFAFKIQPTSKINESKCNRICAYFRLPNGQPLPCRRKRFSTMGNIFVAVAVVVGTADVDIRSSLPSTHGRFPNAKRGNRH